MRRRSSSEPLNCPPSQAGRHVTMTGRRRPASAPATSGSLTESSRSSTRSASATLVALAAELRRRRRGHGDAEQRCRVTDQKKSLFNRSAEEARESRRAVAGQAKADASSAVLQYHHADTRHGGRARPKRETTMRRGTRPTTGSADDTRARAARVNRIAHFSLTSKHFSSYNRIEIPCRCRRLALALACWSSLVARSALPCRRPRRWASPRSGPAWSASAGPCSTARSVEEFKAHILGVIENVIGTAAQPDSRAARRRAARQHRRHRRHERQPGLHRRPADRRGVVLARQFSKEPIAGITPIAEMTDATAVHRRASGRRARAASSFR